MSSSYSSMSNTPSSLATPTQPPAPHDSRFTIVGVVLGIIGLLCVAGVIYATMRMKRTKQRVLCESEWCTSTLPKRSLDRHHPAVQITPFGSEAPRFKHIPGSNMRIATRRHDGVWQFSDPRDSSTPSGVSEIDVMPPPSSAKGVFLPPVYTLGSTSSWKLRFDYESHHQFNVDPPPPTYGLHYSSDLISSHKERTPELMK